MPVPKVPQLPPGSALSEQEVRQGLAIYLLFLDPAEWTHRRVESIEILDDESIHRRITLDLTINPNLLPGIGEIGFTPLTLLRKGVLRNFDLRSSDGCSLSVLNKAENSHTVGNALVALAETILAERVPPSIERRLRFLTESAPKLAKRELASWQESAESPGADQERWQTLMAVEPFVDLAKALSVNFVLLAACDPKPGTRHLFKFSYDERFSPGELADWKRPFLRLGWARSSYEINVPSISLSDSYHLELAAPDNLEIDAAQLRIYPLDPSAGPAPPGDTDRPGVQRAHLYTSGIAPEFAAKAIVLLRRRRDAFLWSAFLTSLLVTFVLVAGLLRLDHLIGQEDAGQSQTAGALLLIMPTLLAAYVTRPEEHRLASKLLLGVRILVIGAALCAILAVAVLASGYDVGTARCIWVADLIASGVITFGLFLSLILPRPTHE